MFYFALLSLTYICDLTVKKNILMQREIGPYSFGFVPGDTVLLLRQKARFHFQLHSKLVMIRVDS